MAALERGAGAVGLACGRAPTLGAFAKECYIFDRSHLRLESFVVCGGLIASPLILSVIASPSVDPLWAYACSPNKCTLFRARVLA